MKLNLKTVKEINNFIRTYAEPGYKKELGTIRLSGFIENKLTTKSLKHNRTLSNICLFLFHYGIPFITEFKMKGGLRPDIVAPTHIKKVIEVLHTETIESFREKKLPKYLKLGIQEKDIIFIRTDEVLTFEKLN